MQKRRSDHEDDLDETFDIAEQEEASNASEDGDLQDDTDDEEDPDGVPELGRDERFSAEFDYSDDDPEDDA